MTDSKKPVRCVVYTRKSSEEGLEQEFNSLDAQRVAGEAYINSQKYEGWLLLPNQYNNGGISGGTMEHLGLQQLLADVQANKVDVVVAYKVGRLSRSLGDFAQIIDLFDKHNVSFVSVTQQFNTTSSMGRLTLSILLSFTRRQMVSGRAPGHRRSRYVGKSPQHHVNQQKGACWECQTPDTRSAQRTIVRTGW